MTLVAARNFAFFVCVRVWNDFHYLQEAGYGKQDAPIQVWNNFLCHGHS